MNHPKRLEIHSHSTVSDGRYSPAEMARLMAENNVELWALTDHDTCEGCALAREAAGEHGLEFVSGIELSARSEGQSIHVLGYGIDETSERIAEYGRASRQARRERMEQMVKRMNDLGVAITMEEISAISRGGNMGRPHLARALVKRGYAATTQAAFDRWLARGRPAYLALTRLGVDEAIEMIGQAGGLAVLAHPARYGDLSGRLEDWKSRGLWGMEARHPSHTLKDEEHLVRLADRFGLGKTASNDWHGSAPSALDRLGTVRFPDSWRGEFLRAISEGD